MKRGTAERLKTELLAEAIRERWEMPPTLALSSACGMLERLWHEVARNAPNGMLGPTKIAERFAGRCGWPGEPRDWLAVMSHPDLRWLERLEIDGGEAWAVHDWHDHADDNCRKRLEGDGATGFWNGAPIRRPKGGYGKPYCRETLPRAIRESFANRSRIVRESYSLPEPIPEPVEDSDSSTHSESSPSSERAHKLYIEPPARVVRGSFSPQDAPRAPIVCPPMRRSEGGRKTVPRGTGGPDRSWEEIRRAFAAYGCPLQARLGAARRALLGDRQRQHPERPAVLLELLHGYVALHGLEPRGRFDPRKHIRPETIYRGDHAPAYLEAYDAALAAGRQPPFLASRAADSAAARARARRSAEEELREQLQAEDPAARAAAEQEFRAYVRSLRPRRANE